MWLLQCDGQGPSLLCMNEVLGQLGEIGEIEQEGSNVKVYLLFIIFYQIFTRFLPDFYRIFYQDWLMAANKGFFTQFWPFAGAVPGSLRRPDQPDLHQPE